MHVSGARPRFDRRAPADWERAFSRREYYQSRPHVGCLRGGAPLSLLPSFPPHPPDEGKDFKARRPRGRLPACGRAVHSSAAAGDRASSRTSAGDERMTFPSCICAPRRAASRTTARHTHGNTLLRLIRGLKRTMRVSQKMICATSGKQVCSPARVSRVPSLLSCKQLLLVGIPAWNEC